MKRSKTVMPRMSMRWYAVIVGDYSGSDYGSFHKREAIEMAREAAKENPDEEVYISLCTSYPDDDFCDGTIVIHEPTVSIPVTEEEPPIDWMSGPCVTDFPAYKPNLSPWEVKTK